MEYRILGKTGLRVSRMGLGGIPIQKADSKTAREILLKMLEVGANYIDTAWGYTVSEEYLGEALVGIREKFILATKSMAKDKESMAWDVETSLRNLRTDYIDLYQIHNPSPADFEKIIAPGGALEALLEAKAAGKIGHIGFTTHSAELFKKVLDEPWAETVMFPYNIVENQGAELITACREKNIGFIDMKPLAGGALEDAPLALRYIAANEFVDLLIPGMKSADQVAENAAAVDNPEPLSENEFARIDVIRKTLGTQFCRRCNYCPPCSAGISISAVFLFEGYLTRYGLADWAKARYSAMAKTASDCIGCGDCESRCPYNLPIRKMLKSAAEKFGK